MPNGRSIAFAAGVPLLCACLLLAARGLLRPEPSSTLTAKLEGVVGRWAADKIPMNDRTVTLLIGDANAGEDVLSLPQAPAERSFKDKLRGLLGLSGQAPTVNAADPFTRAFGKDKSAVAWTFDGFSKADEKAVVEELAKNIVKVHDSGAVLNLVARGEVGAAVLKSVKSLEGQVRGGVQVGVNSLVLLGMDAEKLKAYDPAYFAQVKRPGNVGEWANVYGGWVKGGVYGAGVRLEESTVEIFSAKYDGAKVPGRFLTGLLPPADRISSSGLPIKLGAFASAIIGVFDRQGGLEQWVTQQQWLEQKQADELRRQADEEARRQAEEEAKRRAEEEERHQAAARLAAAEAARKEADAKKASEAAQRRRAQSAVIQWIPIRGGAFMMGSEDIYDAKPRHRVTVRSFSMAKTLVTNVQYEACVRAGSCTAPDASCMVELLKGDDQPVVCVNWDQANTFSHWAGGRLPSEAEWEYAARSRGREQEYPWGNETPTCERAVIAERGDGSDNGCDKNATWPVCSKPAGNTAQGLCDMAGNAEEWMQDWWHGSNPSNGTFAYQGAPIDGSAWGVKQSVDQRVVRGGSWHGFKDSLRAAFRSNDATGQAGDDNRSFRPVR